MEDTVLTVRREVVNHIQHEVCMSPAIGSLVTEVAVMRYSYATKRTVRLREVIELTTLELHTHPEGRRHPATYCDIGVDEADAIREGSVLVLTCEVDDSSIPYFDEPVSRGLILSENRARATALYFLSLKATSSHEAC